MGGHVEMFEKRIEAWRHGSAIADLCHAFRSQGTDVGNPAANIPVFEDENDICLLRQMYEIYEQHTARQLSDLTCEGGALHVAMGDWRSFHSHPG